jgi:hypothetical protein
MMDPENATEERQDLGVLQEKIKKSVLDDIQRANDFFQGKVEPVFRMRRQLYDADKDHYAKRFPLLSRQSDFVSHDLWSLIQWAIPSLMNSFFNGGEAIAIVGRSGEDVEKAEVFKSLIDFQVMVQNSGFLVMWDWFTNAFVYNLGAVKVSWKREEEMIEEYMEQVDISKMMALMQSGAQVIEQGPPDPMSGGLSYVRYVVPRVKTNQPRLEALRVTELRWSPEARSLDDANFVAQRKLVSADHLRKNSVSRGGMYDDAAVEYVIDKGRSDGIKVTDLESALNDELTNIINDTDNPARQLYELYECYVKVDIDGDGILEDAIVSIVGSELLRVEENPWGRVPIFTISPIRDTDKVVASLSFAEIVGELQDLKTAIIRQLVVNTANTNNQRFFVDEGKIVLSDLIEGKQYVRVIGGTDPRMAVLPYPQAGIGPWTLPLLESMEAMIEEWTGKTRYNQGLDGKSLNKTATGITLLTEASEQRMDYIIRVCAETGVSQMMRFLVQLDQMYVDQAQVVRVSNKYLEITPDDIKGEFDIDINTEAGIGKRKQNIQNLQFYLSAIAPFGMQIGAVTPAEWAKAAQKLLLESGIRNASDYVKDPAIIQQEMVLRLLQTLVAGPQPQQGGGEGNANQGGATGPLPGPG